MHLHSLPFSVGFNGPAEIDEAFPVVLNKESNIFESAFRGRKLIGRSHELPQSLESNLQFKLFFLCNLFLVSCIKFDKSAMKIAPLKNYEDLKEKICVIEWNKADLPEPSKFEITNFSKLTQLQKKVRHKIKSVKVSNF